MIATIHQPYLLPYTGVWHKMAKSDVFIFALHDQFQKGGYQNRVRMRGSWVTLPIDGKGHLVPAKELRVKAGWQKHLADSIRGRYAHAPYWRERGTELVDKILRTPTDWLAEIDYELMRYVQGLLGIDTPIEIQLQEPHGQAVERVLDQLKRAHATEYLSGAGARGYIDEAGAQRFVDEGIKLTWSRHIPPTSDSIMTVLMEESDPLAAVLAEEPETEESPCA